MKLLKSEPTPTHIPKHTNRSAIDSPQKIKKWISFDDQKTYEDLPNEIYSYNDEESRLVDKTALTSIHITPTQKSKIKTKERDLFKAQSWTESQQYALYYFFAEVSLT